VASPSTNLPRDAVAADAGVEGFDEKEFCRVTVREVKSCRCKQAVRSMQLRLQTDDNKPPLCIRVVESEGLSMLDCINSKVSLRCVPL
jgi:hypothetical protein